MPNAGNPLHVPRHQMLQPMVPRREKPSVGRSLSLRRQKRQRTHQRDQILLPFTGSLSLRDSSVAERNNLVADCVAAQITRERAVERGTHEKQDRAWRRWNEYIRSIGIKEDLFLENFTREHKHIIIGAFAMAVREARFSRASHERLAAGTVKDTVQYVCVTFRENGYPNPSIDDDGLPAFILQ